MRRILLRLLLITFGTFLLTLGIGALVELAAGDEIAGFVRRAILLAGGLVAGGWLLNTTSKKTESQR